MTKQQQIQAAIDSEKLAYVIKTTVKNIKR